MYERIAFVKIGWSDDYQGGPVLGRFAHVREYKDAHERFNFLQHADGRYYGCLPPIGPKKRPPQPRMKDDWLLVFVSARNGNGPLTVVGWYKGATFHEEYIQRPEYSDADEFEFDVHGDKYSYCINAGSAHLVPTASRTRTVSGDHLKRSPVLYVRGNAKADAWRRELAHFAETLVAEQIAPEQRPPRLSFSDPRQRKLVEEAAIKAAKGFLGKEYHVKDRQKDNRGYDLLARHRETGKELHVEVKGTGGEIMHFYMTRNEYRYMQSPQWRLIIVCDALGSAQTTMLDAAEVKRKFSIDPFAWEAVATE